MKVDHHRAVMRRVKVLAGIAATTTTSRAVVVSFEMSILTVNVRSGLLVGRLLVLLVTSCSSSFHWPAGSSFLHYCFPAGFTYSPSPCGQSGAKLNCVDSLNAPSCIHQVILYLISIYLGLVCVAGNMEVIMSSAIYIELNSFNLVG